MIKRKNKALALGLATLSTLYLSGIHAQAADLDNSTSSLPTFENQTAEENQASNSLEAISLVEEDQITHPPTSRFSSQAEVGQKTEIFEFDT